MNYEKIGLKAGLEIHQQLNTGKLFMRTPSILTDEADFVIERKLRPVPSELGEYDKAAIDAFKRNETFYYSGKNNNISLVELDEEPPQPIDRTALKTALEVCLMCKSNPVKKAVIMRKTIIDGSNTSAFQRTMLLSLGGEIEIKNKKIGVATIALEEDSARPLKKENGKVYYNLDRLGIPLIELATEPDIKTPEEAVETAKKIGEIMRLTCQAMRGKGTIRQDVNISIAKGSRCEIKGCQDLLQIGTVIEKEVERQIDLLKLMEILKENLTTGKTPPPFFGEAKEITKLFSNTDCKFIKGKTVFAVKLFGMKNILGTKIGEKRFGSELSNYAKAKGVTGLLHRDELPNYGISANEFQKILTTLECKENDSFIIIVAEKEKAEAAFESVKERIKIAFEKIPEETRGALEDGSSIYQRPLAGGARMYPETDLLEEEITQKTIDEINKNLPKNVEQRETHYTKLGLSENFVNGMKLNNYALFFEDLVEKGANPKVVANLLLNDLSELKRNGASIENVSQKEIEELILLEKKGKIHKNNLKSAFEELSKGKTIEEIIKSKNNVSEEKIENLVSEIVKNNSDLVIEKKFGAIGPLMGDVMKSIPGVDGKTASDLLKKEIEKILKN
jgi:glutamyl-tRNA(Gln) amidotransferase subunit E